MFDFLTSFENDSNSFSGMSFFNCREDRVEKGFSEHFNLSVNSSSDGVEAGVETTTLPALVPLLAFAEAGAEAVTPPTLSPDPTLPSLKVGAETDTPPFSGMVSRSRLLDRRLE